MKQVCQLLNCDVRLSVNVTMYIRNLAASLKRNLEDIVC
jgi:hypothetical protein